MACTGRKDLYLLMHKSELAVSVDQLIHTTILYLSHNCDGHALTPSHCKVFVCLHCTLYSLSTPTYTAAMDQGGGGGAGR